MGLIVTGIVAVLLIHSFRHYLMHKHNERVHDAPFEGRLFIYDDTVIAIRTTSDSPEKAVICFPGYLEDMRYFTDIYADFDGQLILVNNAGYHSPFELSDAETLDWPANPEKLGTIEHDGFTIGLVMKHLVDADDIVLHGHSRGGGVMLDAGRQFPELFKQKGKRIRAFLEAPVVPQGRPTGRVNKDVIHTVIKYMLPIVFPRLRFVSERILLSLPMTYPKVDAKTEMLGRIFSSQKQYKTSVENIHNIGRWHLTRFYDLYDNYEEVVVFVGQRDDVLNNRAILASAKQRAHVKIIQTEKTNHFISFERPHYILDEHKQ